MIWLRAWFSYIVLTPPLTFDSVLLVTCVLSLRLQILLATAACNRGMQPRHVCGAIFHHSEF